MSDLDLAKTALASVQAAEASAHAAEVALTQLVTDLTPPPPPPPPPTNRDGRVNLCTNATSQADKYTLSPAPSATQKAWMVQHWNRAITYVPQIQAWHPGCWRYLDVLAIYVGSATASQHPEWILKDASGKQLTFFSSQQYLGDIGNPAYQDAKVADAKAYLAANGKGLHLDDVDMDRVVVPTAINPRTKAVYTFDQWRKDLADLVVKIRLACPAPVEIVHNALWWSDLANADVVRQMKACDVYELERGFNDANYTPAKIEELFAWCDTVHGMGLGLNHLSEAAGSQAAHFNLACALLVSNGKDYVYGDGWRPDAWDAIYDSDLGSSTGPRAQTAAHVWERPFARGHVKADLNTKTGVVTVS